MDCAIHQQAKLPGGTSGAVKCSQLQQIFLIRYIRVTCMASFRMSSNCLDSTCLSDHPKPAIYDHLKTGHMETHPGTLTA